MRASLAFIRNFGVRRSAPIAVAVAFGACLGAASAQQITPSLENIRARHGLPALAAAAIKDGKLVAIGATGLRRLGGKEPVTTEDRWHIGSCTKSMTSALAAVLVKRGLLKWDQTVGDTLRTRCPGMNDAWRPVTLEQLLSHRAGAPPEPPADLWAEAWKLRGSPSAQRWDFTRGLLKTAPVNPPGTKYAYSNQGYAIAGQMMEVAGKKPWENLMQEFLFQPLGLRSAGFGAAGDPRKVDQPWGHKGATPIAPGPQADNPPAIAPGAAVHLSIADFARYAAWHVQKKDLLDPEQFSRLHTAPQGQDYALGLQVTSRPWSNGPLLTHNGSNTMNFAIIWIAPARNFTVVAATNIAGENAEAGCTDACTQLVEQLLSATK